VLSIIQGIYLQTHSTPRKYRNAAEENRFPKECKICHRFYPMKLARHITEVHHKSRATARRLAAIARQEAKARAYSAHQSGLAKKMTKQRAREIFGDRVFEKENFVAKLSQALCEVGSELVSDDELPSEQLDESPGEEDAANVDDDHGVSADASTKKLVQTYLPDKCEKTEVFKLYAQHLEENAKNERTANNRKSNISRYMGFAAKLKPASKSGWDLIVDTEVGREFVSVLVNKCKAAPATVINYVKDVTAILDNATKVWSSKIPRRPTWKSLLSDAIAFWASIKKKYERKRTEQKNEKLAHGEDHMLDLRTVHEYLDDPAVKTEMDRSFLLLENHVRLNGARYKITRADVAVSKAWNAVVSFLMMSILAMNGSRTGDLQNFTMKEYDAAKAAPPVGELRHVKIKSHKNSDLGITSVMVERKTWVMLERYHTIRSKLDTKAEEVFVSTGGETFKKVHDHINNWRRKKGLPPINTNDIRKAVGTAAGLQSYDVQMSVSNQLNHLLSTEKQNYRYSNAEAAERNYQATQFVQRNAMALSIYKEKGRSLFEGEEMPEMSAVEKTLAEELQCNFKLSSTTYHAMKKFWGPR